MSLYKATESKIGFNLSLKLCGKNVNERLNFLEERSNNPGDNLFLERRRRSDKSWKHGFDKHCMTLFDKTLSSEQSIAKHNSNTETNSVVSQLSGLGGKMLDNVNWAHENALNTFESEWKQFDELFSWKNELAYGLDVSRDVFINEYRQLINDKKNVEMKYLQQQQKTQQLEEDGGCLFLELEFRKLYDLEKEYKVLENKCNKKHSEMILIEKKHKEYTNDLETRVLLYEREKKELQYKKLQDSTCTKGCLHVTIHQLYNFLFLPGIKNEIVHLRLKIYLKNDDNAETEPQYTNPIIPDSTGSFNLFETYRFDTNEIRNSVLIMECVCSPITNIPLACNKSLIDVSEPVLIRPTDTVTVANNDPAFIKASASQNGLNRWLNDNNTHVLSNAIVPLSQVRDAPGAMLSIVWGSFCKNGKVNMTIEFIHDEEM